MKVSVIIPCLNSEDYLGSAIGSLMRQTHAPHEIIVADNGSSDASREVARSFGGRVRLIEVPELGASMARLAGFAESDGDALMFFDADDLLAPETLAALVAALHSGEGDIACAPWYRFERSGEAWHWSPPSCEPRQNRQDDLSAWLTGWYHPPCSVLWSRSAYEHSGGWDPAIAVNQDGDLMMRALARGATLARTKQGAAFYRRIPRGGSLSSTARSERGIAARLKVIERIIDLLEQGRKLDAYRSPLTFALSRIAADIAPGADLLPRRCEALRARLGDAPSWRRARGLRPSGSGRPGPAPAPPTRGSGAMSFDVPLVSVVIPTYNRMGTIRRAIASVLAQDYAPLELIVVDDGSTDETCALVEAIADDRIRLVRQPNGGVGAARNRGINEARGGLIAFCDSDDEWLPGKLSAQVALFRAGSPRLGFVYSGIESLAADGTRSVHKAEHRGWIYRDLLASNVVTGCGSTPVFRREALALVGGYDTGLPANEDYDLVLRVARFYEADCISRPCARYHDGPADVDAAATKRVSRNLAGNRASRAILFQRYGEDMRREGVLHLFFIATAQRELFLSGMPSRAIRSAVKAILSRPSSAFVYRWAMTMFLPEFARHVLSSRSASSPSQA
jgi:O-antigen biosynthesis protein